MTKQEYITKNGLTLRKVTAEDRKAARTDYQRTADYIISDGTKVAESGLVKYGLYNDTEAAELNYKKLMKKLDAE